MANFSELSGLKQWGAVLLGGALVTTALYFTIFKNQSDKNTAAQHALQDKVRENNELESYRPKLKDMDRQLANLKQQLEIERRIVPDEKQVDTFIETLDGEADEGGRGVAALYGQTHRCQGVLLGASLRSGAGWSVLLDAEFFRPAGQAGAFGECERASGFRIRRIRKAQKRSIRTCTRRMKAW